MSAQHLSGVSKRLRGSWLEDGVGVAGRPRRQWSQMDLGAKPASAGLFWGNSLFFSESLFFSFAKKGGVESLSVG